MSTGRREGQEGGKGGGGGEGALEAHPARRALVGKMPLLGRLVAERVEVAAEFEGLLTRLGLADFQGVWGFSGGTVVTRHRDRSVVRVEIGRGDQMRTLFVKRLARAHIKEMIESLLSFERPTSKCQREWRYARLLAENGISKLPVAAMGQARLGPIPLESFLVVAGLDGALSLDEFLEKKLPGPDTLARRALARKLAQTVARMHGARIFHQDLYAKHIFIRREGGDFVINMIDLQRMRRSGRRTFAVKDLAALNVTIPWRLASRGDRLRFLREYLDARGDATDRGDLRRLARKVLKRSCHIGSRRKFGGIAWLRTDAK